MRKIFTSSLVIALVVIFTTLSGCSSGGKTESGLGLEVSGQWRGQLTERRTGINAGTISLTFQSDNNPLNPLFSTNHAVFGTIAYENFRSDICPLGSIVGTVEGEVVGNDIVISSDDDDDFFITLGGVINNTTINGDWNMHFEFEIVTIVVDADGNEEEKTTDAACNNFGTWSAVKTNS